MQHSLVLAKTVGYCQREFVSSMSMHGLVDAMLCTAFVWLRSIVLSVLHFPG